MSVEKMVKTGRSAIFDQFLADGIEYIFGNPGTVEQGFLDALGDYPAVKYILTLQETVAVMAANGYARARGKPVVVQVHSTPGLGNAVGALYHAMMDHAPLVVIGGDAGIRYQALEAHMFGDLVGFGLFRAFGENPTWDTRSCRVVGAYGPTRCGSRPKFTRFAEEPPLGVR
jgi:thiamine pyrophosphate-dependent acetolactate synthase large subunit-like protein